MRACKQLDIQLLNLQILDYSRIMHQSTGTSQSQTDREKSVRASSAKALQRGKACINCRRRKMVSSDCVSSLSALNASFRSAMVPGLFVGLAKGQIEGTIANIPMPKVVRVRRC